MKPSRTQERARLYLGASLGVGAVVGLALTTHGNIVGHGPALDVLLDFVPEMSRRSLVSLGVAAVGAVAVRWLLRAARLDPLLVLPAGTRRDRAFPIVTLVAWGLGPGMYWVASKLAFGPLSHLWNAGVTALIGAGIFIAAGVLQLVPNLPRRWCFEAATLASSLCVANLGTSKLWPIGLVVCAGVLALWLLVRPDSTDPPSFTLRRVHRVVHALRPAAVIGGGAVVFLVLHALTVFEPSSLVAAHGRVEAIAEARVVAAVVPLVPIYVTARWFLVTRMARNPILYLRSFSDTRVAEAFGAILAPEASARGVVALLSHHTQRPADLVSRTSEGDFPEFTAVPDPNPGDRVDEATWKRWVLSNIDEAAAVILDPSVVSKGVGWELEQVTRSCPDRTLLLVERSALDLTRTWLDTAQLPIPIVPYDLSDEEHVEESRRLVASWLDHLLRRSGDSMLHVPSPVPSPAATRAHTPRTSSAPIWIGVSVLVLLAVVSSLSLLATAMPHALEGLTRDLLTHDLLGSGVAIVGLVALVSMRSELMAWTIRTPAWGFALAGIGALVPAVAAILWWRGGLLTDASWMSLALFLTACLGFLLLGREWWLRRVTNTVRGPLEVLPLVAFALPVGIALWHVFRSEEHDAWLASASPAATTTVFPRVLLFVALAALADRAGVADTWFSVSVRLFGRSARVLGVAHAVASFVRGAASLPGTSTSSENVREQLDAVGYPVPVAEGIQAAAQALGQMALLGPTLVAIFFMSGTPLDPVDLATWMFPVATLLIIVMLYAGLQPRSRTIRCDVGPAAPPMPQIRLVDLGALAVLSALYVVCMTGWMPVDASAVFATVAALFFVWLRHDWRRVLGTLGHAARSTGVFVTVLILSSFVWSASSHALSTDSGMLLWIWLAALVAGAVFGPLFGAALVLPALGWFCGAHRVSVTVVGAGPMVVGLLAAGTILSPFRRRLGEARRSVSHRVVLGLIVTGVVLHFPDAARLAEDWGLSLRREENEAPTASDPSNHEELEPAPAIDDPCSSGSTHTMEEMMRCADLGWEDDGGSNLDDLDEMPETLDDLLPGEDHDLDELDDLLENEETSR